MAAMTDPINALVSFQKDVRRGLPVQPTESYKNTFVVRDEPNGRVRYTYLKIEHGRVKALAMFVAVAPIEGLPCFQVGYAVPETYRNRGWASDILAQGVEELKKGFGRHGHGDFYIEAIVGLSNLSSQAVAAKVFGNPQPTTDCFSGEPALAYKRRIGSLK